MPSCPTQRHELKEDSPWPDKRIPKTEQPTLRLRKLRLLSHLRRMRSRYLSRSSTSNCQYALERCRLTKRHLAGRWKRGERNSRSPSSSTPTRRSGCHSRKSSGLNLDTTKNFLPRTKKTPSSVNCFPRERTAFSLAT